MGNRSRLRTQNVGRRRLVVLLVLLGTALGGWVLTESQRGRQLWERAATLLETGREQLATDLETRRGTIYDRNYKEFAISYERVSVYANIREIEDVNQVIGPLSAILETSESDLYDRMGQGRLRVWLARDISQDQEDEIRGLDFSGVYLHKEYVRYYPQGESAAHLIGFVEGDIGLAGIEHFLDTLDARFRLAEADTGTLQKVGDTRPGIDGRHLILTLDSKIQGLIEAYLQRLATAAPGNRYGALVMEPASGGVIAYGQTPSFDPNRFHSYPESSLHDIFNERIGVPEPFKIFLRDLALLESQAGGTDGLLPWSVMAAQRKLGVQLQLWQKLGADGTLHCDFMAAPPADHAAVPFSSGPGGEHGFETVPALLTPLEMLTAMTRALNGGRKVTPQGAKRFLLRRNQQEYLLEEMAKEASPGLLSKGVPAEARALFTGLAEPGPLGAGLLQGESWSVLPGDTDLLFHHYLGLILIPRQDPELVLLLTSTGPGYRAGRKEGASPAEGALKIVGQIAALQQVMKNLSDMMRPSDWQDDNFRGASGEARPEPGKTSETVVEAEMASFIGMSLRKCLRLLQSSEVEIEIQGTGRVVSQHPPAGTKLTPGTRVTLILERDQVDPSYRQPQRTEPE